MSAKKAMFDSDSDRKSTTYPDNHPITLSHYELPTSFKVMEETGMTYGLSVTPFISDQSDRSESRRNGNIGGKVARCVSCSAYINPYCDISSQRWFCSLCGIRNNFSRSTQKRYCYSDPQLLNETANTLADFRLPLIEPRSDGSGSVSSPVSALHASQRPLVHVFLVQESMRIDAMQAVVEGLCASVPSMHPDLRVVFLTYSNRIGIYSFSSGTAVPTIQHVHFVAESASTSCDSIFEGHEMHEIRAQHSVRLMIPLSSVADFHQTATSVGTCCDSYVTALSALFDAYPSANEFSHNDALLPKNMLGAVLEAVTDWILESPASQETLHSSLLREELLGDDSEPTGGQGLGGSLQSGLAQIFGKLGLGGGWGGAGGGANFNRKASPEVASDPLNMTNRHSAPIDLCSGVILHVFLDSPQDLRVGSHDSVSHESITKAPTAEQSTEVVPSQLNTEWVRQLAARCASRSLTVSLWSVTSYEGDEVGLSALEPLATLTGGRLNRSMLGFYPKDERDRLVEILRRSLTCRYASRCLLKLRASPIIDIAESSASGLMLSDEKLPGVYHIGSCSPDTTYTFEFSYKPNMEINETTSHRNAVCIQLAYSYETLVEIEGQDDRDDGDVCSEALLAMGLDGGDGFGEGSTHGAYLSSCAVASAESHLDSALSVLELNGLKELGGGGTANGLGVNGGNGMESFRTGSGKSRRSTPREGGVEDSAQTAKLDVPYDRRRRLATVKYLRIVTVMAEVTSRPVRLFAVCHIPTTMALLVRRAIVANQLQFLDDRTSTSDHSTAQSSGNANKLSVGNRAVKLLMNSVIRLLVHFTKVQLDLKSNRKHKVTYADMLAMPEIDNVLHQLLRSDPLLSEIALRVFAAIDMFESFLQKCGKYSPHHTPYRYATDELVEFGHTALSTDWFHLHRVLYPRLMPLNCANLLLDTHSIALTRMAILGAGGAPEPCQYFLLDAGTEIVLYRSIQSAMSGRTSASEPDNSSIDFLNKLNSLVLLNRQLKNYNSDPTSDSDNVLSSAVTTLQTSSQRSFFLVNYLRRRLNCSSIVPRIYLAEVGTQSASYFTSHLIEERSRSGAVELQQFKDFLVEVIKTSTG